MRNASSLPSKMEYKLFYNFKSSGDSFIRINRIKAILKTIDRVKHDSTFHICRDVLLFVKKKQ